MQDGSRIETSLGPIKNDQYDDKKSSDKIAHQFLLCPRTSGVDDRDVDVVFREKVDDDTECQPEIRQSEPTED